uniref:Uncharacterized protein n=1 Tax=Arundo donax TaxID=35708 RepID=A0A0A8ZKT4_ARUDO
MPSKRIYNIITQFVFGPNDIFYALIL